MQETTLQDPKEIPGEPTDPNIAEFYSVRQVGTTCRSATTFRVSWPASMTRFTGWGRGRGEKGSRRKRRKPLKVCMNDEWDRDPHILRAGCMMASGLGVTVWSLQHCSTAARQHRSTAGWHERLSCQAACIDVLSTSGAHGGLFDCLMWAAAAPVLGHRSMFRPNEQASLRDANHHRIGQAIRR